MSSAVKIVRWAVVIAVVCGGVWFYRLYVEGLAMNRQIDRCSDDGSPTYIQDPDERAAACK